MPTAIHPFSQEEIMAYLDGELSPDRALAAAQHLDECRECQYFAADFRNLSQRLMQWPVKPITSAPPRFAKEKSKKKEFAWMLGLIASAVALSVVIVAITTRPVEQQVKRVSPEHPEQYANLQDAPPGRLTIQSFLFPRGGAVGEAAESASAPPPNAPPIISGPLIIRTAQLKVTTKNLDQSRTDVERITNRHQGYMAQLELNTSTGASRSLSATLRVPAAQLDPMLQELKLLGHVDAESQRGEDVTQHYVDVNARLANLRTTEERLLQILKERTGRLADVLQVEEAVDRTRGEIEVAEAEQKMLSNQIALATLNLSISEDYKVPLEGNETSVPTRLRNAGVEGYRTLVDGIIGTLTFLLSSGPALLVILAIAFIPARWAWRRWRDRLWPFAATAGR